MLELARCDRAVMTRPLITADLFRWKLTLISDVSQDAIDNVC